jgi:hypothetical protein
MVQRKDKLRDQLGTRCRYRDRADALLYRQFFPSSPSEYSGSAGLRTKEFVCSLNRLFGYDRSNDWQERCTLLSASKASSEGIPKTRFLVKRIMEIGCAQTHPVSTEGLPPRL